MSRQRQPKHAKFSGCRVKGFRGLSSQPVEQSRRSTVSTTILPISKPIVFEDDKLIRFHHCDPAGIIFYPQYFVLFNELIEDWFTRGLGISVVDQVTKYRVSPPIGPWERDFVSAIKIGAALRRRGRPHCRWRAPPRRCEFVGLGVTGKRDQR